MTERRRDRAPRRGTPPARPIGDLDPPRPAPSLSSAGTGVEELEQATEVVLDVGPKGGFRLLSYRTPKGSMSVGSKEMAEMMIAFFEKNGIPIERRVGQ